MNAHLPIVINPKYGIIQFIFIDVYNKMYTIYIIVMDYNDDFFLKFFELNITIFVRIYLSRIPIITALKVVSKLKLLLI